MSWRRSIEAAIKDLRREEAALSRELDELRTKIAELVKLGEGANGSSARGTRARAKPRKVRKLSDEGRRAISQAAKRRWAKYRATQDKT